MLFQWLSANFPRMLSLGARAGTHTHLCDALECVNGSDPCVRSCHRDHLLFYYIAIRKQKQKEPHYNLSISFLKHN